MKSIENKIKKAKNGAIQTINSKEIKFYLRNFSENLSYLIKQDQINKVNNKGKYENAYDLVFNEKNKYNNNHIILIALITFHHKQGGIIECTFPSKEELISNEEIKSLIDKEKFRTIDSVLDYILNNLVNYCLTDGIHLSNNETNFFFIHDFQKPLYCLSYYIQKKTDNEENKTEDSFQENIRGCIQKSICIVSTLPIFGNINIYQNYYTHLSTQMIKYMGQKSLNDKSVLDDIYNKLLNEFHQEKKWLFNLRKIVLFLKDDLIIILKLILLEKRIIVFSQIPSNASLLIMTILSLFPGNYSNGRKFFDKQNGTPFKLFYEKYLIYPLFTLFDLDSLLGKIKNNNGINFLIGTTNKLIIENKNLDYNCLINVDEKKIIYLKDISDDIKHINSKENKVLKNIYELINNDNLDDKNNKKIKLEQSWILEKNENDEKEFNSIKKYILSYYLKIIFDISYLIEEIKKNINNDPYGSKLINLYETIQINYLKSTSQNFYCSKDKNNDDIFKEDSLPFIKNIISDPLTYTICSILPIKISNSDSSKKTSVEKKRESILEKINILSFVSQWTKTNNFKKWFYSYNKEIINYSTLSTQEKKTTLYDYEDNLYKGTMILGKKEGLGKYDYKTLKMIYDGSFKNDLREGNGTLTSYDKKFYYEGGWMNNQMEGNGVLYSSQLGKYSGKFHKDFFEGYGSLIDIEDNMYEGNFHKGEKSGKGEMKLFDGSCYTGEFKNDKYHGKGVLKDQKGNIILNGEFKLGSLYKPKKTNNKGYERDNEQTKSKKMVKRKSFNPLSGNELKGIQSIKFYEEYEENEINEEGYS